MVSQGLTIDNQNFIIQKSKTKKDGAYSIRGVNYLVIDNYPRYFAVKQQILQNFGGFNVVIGSCGIYSSEAHKSLIDLWKSL